jgi:L-threonylcarbamoyladenylate synthase
MLAGGIVVFPTETVYGLAVRADDAGARARLRRLKGRPDGKPFQLIVSGVRRAKALCDTFPAEAGKLARAFWPGPLTLVLKSRGRRWIGVRLPDHPVARRLAELCGGAMIATSANRSGRPPARTANEALRGLARGVALALDGGPAALGRASTVVKCDGSRVIILREGAVPRKRIDQALGMKSRNAR